ncbi:MFS transporter [Microbacterium sp. CFH 90308]|uniref:MFS transporter n=1 Tax=Microbacterium salsuginis TaxID=2722803 RepID=A0ABX1K9D0_9MICO|nr:MFS transporter [Microbacterium sp. CFH 90308]NLP83592.1 MFS transporter [Microbacterium sp. CFH 90308]
MSRAPHLRVFGPFGNGRFSLYFSGQVISNTGTWFQNLALSLVVLEATGSAQALSGVTIAQFLPLLVLSIPAGRLADRVRPRTILLVTSLASALVVAGLAVVTLAPEPSILAIYALVGALGTVHAFERVAAQAIIFEIVGPERLGRAVSLSTIALASARSIGPGLAGIAFQALGPTACMLINSASFLLVFASIVAIRPARLFPRARRADRPGGGIRPSFFSRELVTLLVVNAVVALLALNLMLVLTSTVTLTFAGDATAVGVTHTLNALGAIVGGVLAAGRDRVTVRSLIVACGGLGAALLLSAAAPTLAILLAVGPLLGLGVGYYQGILNAAAQVSVTPDQIGRTMSLVTLGNYGMVPFGALLMGWVIDAQGGRMALGIGGLAGLACATFVAVRLRRR